MTDSEIINIIVDNFIKISKIPRPSHHEEKISNYLMEWAKNQGFKPFQDKVNNVIFDVPASNGMEDKPLGMLQVHMDMVVAIQDGKMFDPLNDSINVIRDDLKGTLTSDGTSLGGDDGIGIAIIMAIVEGKLDHGPLRIIITVDEEDGMTGANNIDPKWFSDAKFLINIDNEMANEVLVSTASGNSFTINKRVDFFKSSGTLTLNICLSNLKGGHSGMEIDKGRLNGIIGLTNFLKELDKDDIFYELATIEGGTAPNAIPTKASATIVINNSDKDIIEEKLKKYSEYLNIKYQGIEEDIKCELGIADDLPKVVSREEKENIIKLVTEIIDGVYTMSKDIEDLVESSSNLGIIKLNKNGLELISLIRSSSIVKENEIVNKELTLAKECGYKTIIVKSTEAWPYNPNSKLVELTKKVYKEQNKEDIKVSATHAGLECGTFKKYKDDLDMISIGPNLTGGHTINETLWLKTIPITWHLLEGILKEYK